MKKHIYYFFLAFSLITGCKKNDGPVPVALARVPEPQIVKNGGSQAIDMTNLPDFQGIFDVGLYFSSDIPPSKLDIVVRKNGDNGNIKVFKAGITSFPTTLTITANDLASLFGDPLTLGDSYDIGADVYTQSGKKYEAFPAVGSGYGSQITNQPGASPSIRYSAICKYDDAVYQGNFKVLVDDWADYSPGDVIPVTRIDATHFSFEYPTNDPQPIIITVDPLTNATSVAKQVFGSGYPGWTYGPLSCETGTDQRNVVAPCDQTFGVVLNITVSLGSFGPNYFECQKSN